MSFTDACAASIKRIPRKPVMNLVDDPLVFDPFPLSPSCPISPDPWVDVFSCQTPPGLFDISGAYRPEIPWDIKDALNASAVRFQDAETDEENDRLEEDDEDDEMTVERIFGQSLQRSRRQASLATIASPQTSSPSAFSTPSTPALSRCDSQSSLSSLEQTDDLVFITRSPSTSSIGSVHRKGQHIRSSRWTDHSSRSVGTVSSTEFGADSSKDITLECALEEGPKASQMVEKSKRSFGFLRYGSNRTPSSSRDPSPESNHSRRDSQKPLIDVSSSPSPSLCYPPPAPVSISSAHALFSASLPLIHAPTSQSSMNTASSLAPFSSSPASPQMTRDSKLKSKAQIFSYIQRRSSPPPATLFGLKELRELRLAAEVLQSAARCRINGPVKTASEKGRVKRKAVPVFVLGLDDDEVEHEEITTTNTAALDPGVPLYFHLPHTETSRWSSLSHAPDGAMPPIAIARPKRSFLGQANRSVRTSVAFAPGSMKTGKGIYLGIDGCDDGLRSVRF